ncbi:hypothetical protein UC8_09240 [Roseimaritima ulvae]|uniref:Uncharacterized protein n=1 Tax=Roseimaritima ulvae TaxID=980254 RepID=A0A5B9QYF6_9BACT|nr:hypothetical protein UC8_09240 [Roseimaritima ulvae]
MTEDRLGVWSELLGKMSITFSEGMVETDLNGEKLITPYSVLACDRTSVVLRDDSEEGAWAAEVLGLSTFSKIHFDGDDSYWVFSEPGAIKEYFRRVTDTD